MVNCFKWPPLSNFKLLALKHLNICAIRMHVIFTKKSNMKVSFCNVKCSSTSHLNNEFKILFLNYSRCQLFYERCFLSRLIKKFLPSSSACVDVIVLFLTMLFKKIPDHSEFTVLNALRQPSVMISEVFFRCLRQYLNPMLGIIVFPNNLILPNWSLFTSVILLFLQLPKSCEIDIAALMQIKGF